MLFRDEVISEIEFGLGRKILDDEDIKTNAIIDQRDKMINYVSLLGIGLSSLQIKSKSSPPR
jgi:hypothetical protein